MKRLADRFLHDVGVIFRERQVSLEPRWVTVYYLLARDGAMSVVEIARALGITHPAVHQIAREMLKEGYLVQNSDAQDKRRRLLQLSDSALACLPQMQELWDEVERAASQVIQVYAQFLYALLHFLYDGFSHSALDIQNFYNQVS